MTKLHQLVKQVSAIEMHPGCMNYYWQPEKIRYGQVGIQLKYRQKSQISKSW